MRLAPLTTWIEKLHPKIRRGNRRAETDQELPEGPVLVIRLKTCLMSVSRALHASRSGQ